MTPQHVAGTTGAGAGTGAAPAPDDEALASVLAAVAEPTRLRLLRLLLDGELCVTQCTERTGLLQSLVSKHLARLVAVGLVQRRKAGRNNYHSVVDPEGLRLLLDATAALAQPARDAA